MEGSPPEVRVGRVKVSPAVKEEMMKPLLFGNHQFKFKLFSYLVAAGMTYYFVLKHDFGEKRHCYSWIREFVEAKKRQFFTINPDDPELRRARLKNASEEAAPSSDQSD